MNLRCIIDGARFDERDLDSGVLAQSCCENAACGTPTDDNVVISVLHFTSPISSARETGCPPRHRVWLFNSVTNRSKCAAELTWICRGAQESCRLLPDHNTGRHGVAGRHPRHDRGVSNTEAVHSINSQLAINHRHPIASHFCGARLMPERRKPVAKKPLQLRLAKVARCYLAPRERPQCSGVADLASHAQSGREIP